MADTPRDRLSRAIAIAAEAHAGQLDKGGQPYILHPLRVMLDVASDDARIAAVLHDVVEDCPAWSLDRLRGEGFSGPVLVALEALTRRRGESYDAFVARCAANPIATTVKLADLRDNMDATRLPDPLSEADRERMERYRRARDVLARA